jgi:hypothetical protein
MHYLIKPSRILISTWDVFLACKKHKDPLAEHVSPSLRLMNEYLILLVKLYVDATIWKPKNIARKCYNELTDIQIVAGLACILPNFMSTSTIANVVF